MINFDAVKWSISKKAQGCHDSQLHTCCDERDVASDIETAQGLYNLNGSCCNNWQVDITSQLTILRSTIG